MDGIISDGILLTLIRPLKTVKIRQAIFQVHQIHVALTLIMVITFQEESA